MTLNDYQKAADRTSGDLVPWDKIRNGCYGLNGEAGECIDILKKVEFQGHTFDPNRLIDELGDVLWYVAQTATGLGVSLADVAQHNIDKLRERYPDLQRGQEESQQPVSRLSGLRGREVFLRYGEDLFPEEKDR